MSGSEPISSPATDSPTAASQAEDSLNLSWPSILGAIAQHETLSASDIRAAMSAIMNGNTAPEVVSAFIYGLRVKGIAPIELEAAAAAMLEFARPFDISDVSNVVDIVGTGGDGANTVNISTMASLLSAAAGVTVVKHGNRAASSKSGGADMLESLGINLDLEPEQLIESAAEHHFAFIFAKNFHPAMRFAAPVRSALKVPTLFNLLGPMTNPARPTHGLIGCAFEREVSIMAEAFARRGDTLLVVRGLDGLDEISIASPTLCYVVKDGEARQTTVDPQQLGLDSYTLNDIAGGDPEYNANICHQFAHAEAPAAITDAVLLNAAAAIVTLDPRLSVETLPELLQEKLTELREVLQSGKVGELVDRLTAE